MSAKSRSETITFRLPLEFCRLADEKAAAQGISRGHWARGEILSAITRPDKNDLEAILNHLISTNSELEQRLIELQRALIRHLYYTLTKVGSLEHSVAESLVKEKLFTERT